MSNSISALADVRQPASGDIAPTRGVASTSIRYTRELDGLLDRYDGTTIDVSFRELVGPLPADEYTHGIFPYPARLLRHIPRFLLATEQLTDGVDYVLDPFAGSGTVLLEAQLRGLPSVGVDQNPVATLVSRVKTTQASAAGMIEAGEAILRDAKRSRRSATPARFLSRWYSADALSALGRLGNRIGSEGEADLLALSLVLTARRVAQTDSRIPVPVHSARNAAAAAEDVWEAWRSCVASLAGRVGKLPRGRPEAEVRCGDVRDSNTLADVSRSRSGLLITSPPYGAAQKYIRSTSLDLAWLGHASDRGTIHLERASVGREHLTRSELAGQTSADRDVLQGIVGAELTDQLDRIALRAPQRASIYRQYFVDMHAAFTSMATVVPARIVLISGNNTVAGEVVDTSQHLSQMLVRLGFTRRLSLRDPIRGRSLLTSRRNGVPSPSEFIDVFEGEVSVA